MCLHHLEICRYVPLEDADSSLKQWYILVCFQILHLHQIWLYPKLIEEWHWEVIRLLLSRLTIDTWDCFRLISIVKSNKYLDSFIKWYINPLISNIIRICILQLNRCHRERLAAQIESQVKLARWWGYLWSRIGLSLQVYEIYKFSRVIGLLSTNLC